MGHLPYVKGHMNISKGQAELEVKSVVCLGALEEAEWLRVSSTIKTWLPGRRLRLEMGSNWVKHPITGALFNFPIATGVVIKLWGQRSRVSNPSARAEGKMRAIQKNTLPLQVVTVQYLPPKEGKRSRKLPRSSNSCQIKINTKRVTKRENSLGVVSNFE